MENSPKHLIFDWETVDDKPTSAVASVAFIVFDPTEIVSFEELVQNALRIKFDLSEQYKMGRTWGISTVNWWKEEEQKEAYEHVIKPSMDDVSITRLYELLTNYLNEKGYKPNVGEKIWTRGNEFDPPIMNNIFEMMGWELPYPWWNIRDVRTEVDAITQYWDPNHAGYGYVKNFPYPEGFVKHKEEHDCARDILMMQYAHLNMLNFIEECKNGN